MPNKICPKCQASKHVRVSKCDCGHAFYATKGEVIEKPKLTTLTEPSKSVFSFLKPKVTEEKSEKTEDSKYDKPGPGKKQCKGCQKYIGVRSEICNLCGYNFKSPIISEQKSVIIEKSLEGGPGKGKKSCPSCNKIVGARTSICSCGYDWSKKISKISSLFSEEKSEKPKTLFALINESKKFQLEKQRKEEEKNQGITKFQVEGRGKKVCLTCFQNGDRLCYVPVATRICDCGHIFEKKEKSEPAIRQETIKTLGTYVSYLENNPIVNNISFSLESNNREYCLTINKQLNCEEVDAELAFLDKSEGLNSKQPDEVINYLSNLFKIEKCNITWYWMLSDIEFENEKILPSYLQLSLKNKKFNSTSAYMYKAFTVARDEYIKQKKISGCLSIQTPRYYRQTSKLVTVR